MTFTFHRQVLLANGHGIPAIGCFPHPKKEKPGKVVLVCHGLGVSKEVQKPELERLAAAGYRAFAIDAPHHGERLSGLVKEMDEVDPERANEIFRKIVGQAVVEIPALVTYFRNQEKADVALIGISMGGFTAFGSALLDPKPKVCIPIIASPSFRIPTEIGGEGAGKNPEEHPHRFADMALLAITAGLDKVVRPEPARTLVGLLRKTFAEKKDRYFNCHFPDSGHFMRQEDWNEAWDGVVEWLDRYL